MSFLSEIGNASAAILKTLVGPMLGKDELIDAVGYVISNGPPTSVVPDFIGQHLYDTSTPTWYKAYGTAAGQWTLSGVPSNVVQATTDPVTGTISGLAGNANILGFDHNDGMAATLFNATADWTVAGTTTAPSISLSSTYSKFSTNTVAVNSGTGTDGAKYVSLTNANALSFETKGGKLGLWVYVPDYTKIDSTNGILVYIALESGFTNYFLSTAYKPLFNGWHFIKLSRATSVLTSGQKWASSGGTVTHSDVFAYLRIRVYPAAGADSTDIVFLDSLFSGGRQRKPSVILTFDDGYQSWSDDSLFTAPYKSPVTRMKELGLKGTFFTIPSILGTGGRGTASSYATLAEIQTLYANGNEVGVHGLTDLTSLADTATRSADIAANKAALLELGFTAGNDVYAYPSGAFNISNDGGNEIQTLLVNAGFVAAREAFATKMYIGAECGADLYHHRCIGFEGAAGSETVTLMRQRISDAILAGGSCVLAFHVFKDIGGTESSQLDCKIDNFYKIIDHIYSMVRCGMIENPAFSEWVHQYSPNLPAYGYR